MENKYFIDDKITFSVDWNANVMVGRINAIHLNKNSVTYDIELVITDDTGTKYYGTIIKDVEEVFIKLKS